MMIRLKSLINLVFQNSNHIYPRKNKERILVMKERIRKAIKLLDKKLFGVSLIISQVFMPLSVYATGTTGFTEYNSGTLSGTSVVKGFAKFFSVIGTYGGALYLIGSIFALILAVRNEDTEGRNKAILNMLAAIALLSTGGIITIFGITT